MERETISIDYDGSYTLTCLKVENSEDLKEAILYTRKDEDQIA